MPSNFSSTQVKETRSRAYGQNFTVQSRLIFHPTLDNRVDLTGSSSARSATRATRANFPTTSPDTLATAPDSQFNNAFVAKPNTTLDTSIINGYPDSHANAQRARSSNL